VEGQTSLPAVTESYGETAVLVVGLILLVAVTILYLMRIEGSFLEGTAVEAPEAEISATDFRKFTLQSSPTWATFPLPLAREIIYT
jgi:hypothetical protein